MKRVGSSRGRFHGPRNDFLQLVPFRFIMEPQPYDAGCSGGRVPHHEVRCLNLNVHYALHVERVVVGAKLVEDPQVIKGRNGRTCYETCTLDVHPLPSLLRWLESVQSDMRCVAYNLKDVTVSAL